MLQLELDLHQFEQKYQQSTETFYHQFNMGMLDDSEDYMLWAGIYELLYGNEGQFGDESRAFMPKPIGNAA